jgi:hypothetical protein
MVYGLGFTTLTINWLKDMDIPYTLLSFLMDIPYIRPFSSNIAIPTCPLGCISSKATVSGGKTNAIWDVAEKPPGNLGLVFASQTHTIV